MKVLDLFAGLGGWSQPFRDAGHEVYRVDWDDRFDLELVADINTLRPEDLPWKPDLILASPPCECFSVASIGTHWTGGAKAYQPKTKAAQDALDLTTTMYKLITGMNVPFVIENPRGVMRKVGIYPQEPDVVWYCHYGEPVAKPTDLWHNLQGWKPRPVCHNRRADHGPFCCCKDHQAAPRGARTGTQGRDGAAHRAVIPKQLARSIGNSMGGNL